ncbi:MAG: chromosome segregation SMC family protein [archaeon]
MKKLFMHGFKSFAKPTEILFEKGMNAVIGANGSGKSNVSDSICFVLGRLSSRSMRAKKSANLIYHGGKEGKPAQQATVSMVFDNSNGIFAHPSPDVEISRTVKRDGTSKYHINKEVKTRQEILELLSQAGIDPDGFNIILQSQIDTIIKMHPEEKRQIIEEISGISIYEQRKEKSVKELDRTDQKLKEVKTVLDERRAYLERLDKERQQALRYEKLKEEIRRCEATILNRKIEENNKENSNIDANIQEKAGKISKTQAKTQELRKIIENNNLEIKNIEKEILEKTGIEQENLRSNLLTLKTDLASLTIKRDNFKDEVENTTRKEVSNKEEIDRLKLEISDVEQKSQIKVSSTDKAKYEYINDEIGAFKAKLHATDLEIKTHDVEKNDVSKKEFLLEEKQKDITVLTEKIKDLQRIISSKKIKTVDKQGFKDKRSEHQENLKQLDTQIKEVEREITKLLTRKEIQKSDVEEILTLNKCPKCKQEVSKDYKDELVKGVWELIAHIEKEIEEKSKNKKGIEKDIKGISSILEEFLKKEEEIDLIYEEKRQLDLKREELEHNKNLCAKLEQEAANLKIEIQGLKRAIKDPDKLYYKQEEYQKNIDKLKEDLIKLKLKKPVELHIEKDFATELELKNREIDACERNIKQSKRDRIELNSRLKEISKNLELKNKELTKKEEEQESIEKKFNKMLSTKSSLQNENHQNEVKINEQQMSKTMIEQEINNLRIDKARIEAAISTLQIEFGSYEGIEFLKLKTEELEQRIQKNKSRVVELGTVNFKALEVFDKIKTEYDEIEERYDTVKKEKEEILKIIIEVDKKKKSTFMQTFKAINEQFTKNFDMLSNKGSASLELQDEKDPFAAGLDMVIKLAKGKYMDADSLSGGEKVIVALSLIFAIQKYRPYSFYIFDEIDAALDKRNSERLAQLIKQNVKNSQYIMITHNDAMISQAETLYGTSMQEGVTKIVSLKV